MSVLHFSSHFVQTLLKEFEQVRSFCRIYLIGHDSGELESTVSWVTGEKPPAGSGYLSGNCGRDKGEDGTRSTDFYSSLETT